MNELQSFVSSFPPITRVLFFTTLGVTLAGNYGLVSPAHLLLLPTAVTQFQLWRFVTAFVFYGQLSFGFLMHLYFLYNYSRALEAQHFAGRPADYVFFLTFSALVLSIAGYFFDIVLLSSMLLFAIVYLWSQIFRDVIVSFWFGLKFPAIYLPWVFLGLDVLMGQSPFRTLIGIGVGHLYYYLELVVPQIYGYRVLQTPDIFYHFFPNQAIMAGVGGRMDERAAPPGRQAGGQGQGRYNWGTGRPLQD